MSDLSVWRGPMAICVAALSAAAIAMSAREATQQPAGPATSAPLQMIGVNLSSGEFAPEKVPGTYGKHYIYPRPSTSAPFLAAGFNTVRVPILWERLQPSQKGALDPQELRRLDESLAGMKAYRVVILDLHNYGRYRGAALSGDQGAAMLADFWIRIAHHYESSPNIAFGLMNEPHDIPASSWRRIVDRVVARIRSAGARNLILVPGTRWTGAHSWLSGPDSNASAFAGFRDPANNFLFEVHQYFDTDSSGQKPNCVGSTVGSRRLEQFTRWARREKARALLGEFGVGPNPVCLAAMDDLLRYMSNNADVWAGGTYWAAGDWWGAYPFNVQPEPGKGPKPQMQVLRRYVAGAAR